MKRFLFQPRFNWFDICMYSLNVLNMYQWAPTLTDGVIREALTLLAAQFDHEALRYRRKCRETRAEHYEDMANAIRNHIDWTCDQMARLRKETT